LLPFAHYCGILAERSMAVRLLAQVADPELRLATIISVGTSFFTEPIGLKVLISKFSEGLRNFVESE
jgi:hypothetical protein